MKHSIYYFAILFLSVIFLLTSCAPTKCSVRKVTFAETRKLPVDTTIVLTLPKIDLAQGTKQMQLKGDITVSCELVPFVAERSEVETRNVTYADPNLIGYDVFEVSKTPYYSIKPEELQFKIRIKNNQDRVLKLVEVPIILIVDNIQTSIIDETLIEWKAALIVKGFEKEFLIRGPKLSQLLEAKSIYIAVHDVPVLYDKAGNITKKDNFEWTFQVSKQELRKPDQITYLYDTEPIYKEQCKACDGIGSLEETKNCHICKGRGKYIEKGKEQHCYTCKGTGKITEKNVCSSCYGKGVLEYPKSTPPPIATEVIWTGWDVRIETNPPGAKVSVIDINTGDYKNAGVTNIEVRWFSSSESFPIIVEYQGKQVKVLPFKQDGKESDKVSIDFTSGIEPQVLVGRKIE